MTYMKFFGGTRRSISAIFLVFTLIFGTLQLISNDQHVTYTGKRWPELSGRESAEFYYSLAAESIKQRLT
jgi:hypothetical protein